MSQFIQISLITLLCICVGCTEAEQHASVKSPDENSQIVPINVSQTPDSLEVFKQRIVPIFQSPNPSSCSECHLSGIDLKNYIRPTEKETFAALVHGGLIDTENPDASKLLEFIERRPEAPSLIKDEVRKLELEAFRTWIHAAVANPELGDSQQAPGVIGPSVPLEVVRHARTDRVMQSFLENIWTEVGRCAACHSPDRNQEKVEEFGEEVSWIVLNDPLTTLNYMVEYKLIDTDAPEQSLLLKKPTLQVDHGGGEKMVVGDRTYKQFRRFIDDYAATVHGRYSSADQLPEPSPEQSVVTDIWLKIEGVPAKYDKKLLQVDLYRWKENGWSKDRVATSDRPIFGGGNLWQHSLSVTAPRDAKEAQQLNKQQLQPGRYLAKLYIDQEGKLESDFRYELGEDEFVGQIELESQWPAGYGKMTIVQFPQ